MPSSGISGYAAVNARVRAMYSTLLSPQTHESLAEAADFNSLTELLKHTAYGPYLERVRDQDFTPRRVAYLLRCRMADGYYSIINTVPDQTRPLLTQLYRGFEVSNLKAILRGILSGEKWDLVRYLLFPYRLKSLLPAEEMLASGNIPSAVELLRGTSYYDVLSFAMKRYNTEQSLFPLEVTLDLSYWRELWKYVKQLAGQDRTQAMRIIGKMLDMTNLMWAIRYRIYYHLSEEEIINYTLPFGFRVHDEDIRGIAAGAEIAHIIERLYPDLTQVDTLLEDSGRYLTRLEVQLQKHVADDCQATFVGDPFHVGIPLAYLVLSDYEVQDLTALIEAKASDLPPESFQDFMVMSNPSGVR